MHLAATAGVLIAAAAAQSPPAPPSTSPESTELRCLADAAAPLTWPAGWSQRRRLVHLAVCEWVRFGHPVVELQRTDERTASRLPSRLGLAGDLRDLPQRPSYEGARPALVVQTRAASSASDPAMAEAIEAYWTATDPAYVSRLHEARTILRRALPHADGNEPTELYPGWWRPWSAAFISWMAARAEVPWFRGSEWHSLYLARSTQDRPDRLVRIEEYRPVAGDLVCFGRTGADGPQGLPTSQAFIERVRAIRSSDDAFAGHCDVVVRVDRSSVVTIGGNVRSAVAATVTPLVGGRLMRSNAWPWSAALRMDGPPDPCARIEAVPAGPWGSEVAAVTRRRVLRGARC